MLSQLEVGGPVLHGLDVGLVQVFVHEQHDDKPHDDNLNDEDNVVKVADT